MSFDVKMVIFCSLLNGYFRSLSNELSNFGRERLKNLLYEYKSFSFNLCCFWYDKYHPNVGTNTQTQCCYHHD